MASIEAFLDMMAAERGASRNTLDAYRRDLVSFETHLARYGGSARNATREQVRRLKEKRNLGGEE